MSTTDIDEPTPAAPVSTKREGSFLNRLTTGTGAFDILGKRRYYYIFSSTLVLASILFIVFKGFFFGIDFAGGTRLTFQPVGGVALNTQTVEQVFADAAGTEGTVQTIGQQNTIQISSATLDPVHTQAAKQALTTAFKLPPNSVSSAAVSGTWGAEISQRAILAVVIFLILVGVFIWIRYEKRVAVGAVASTIHDVIVTAGIYAAVGFEVTPATVIGLLTILGFSLYDTVVVYDKVQENTKGLTSLTRRTYPEAANLAVNQTLMRSINTSLIALLPVAGLLVAGVAILGSGTLKDLSLVLLVGMLVGAYSSVFVAVPLAVDLKIREPQIRAHTARVLAKRKQEGLIVDADGDPIGRKGVAPVAVAAPSPVALLAAERGLKAGAAPKPGARPIRPGHAPAVSTTKTTARPATKPATKPAPRPAATAVPESVADAASTGGAASGNAPVPTPAASSAPKTAAPKTAATSAGRPRGKSARPTGKRGR